MTTRIVHDDLPRAGGPEPVLDEFDRNFVARSMVAVGVTVGFHRCFTHRSFTAPRALRVALAVAGSTAVQGDITTWVADHRRHHAFSDKEGDPHSPWRYGNGGDGQSSVSALDGRRAVAPAIIGGLATWSWWGALTAFLRAGLVRVMVLHHTTWPINLQTRAEASR